jgi:hypothetical protein
MLAAMGVWWMWRFIRTLVSGKRVPPEAVWACAMLFLLWFDALFSRPYHRIEIAVWMSLAFAVANRAIIPKRSRWAGQESDYTYRCFGAFAAIISLAGIVFIGGGMVGDKLIYRGLYVDNPLEVRRGSIVSAGKFPMARDDAMGQLATLDLTAGRAWSDNDTYVRGVEEMYAAFLAQPNSERMFKVFECARELNNADLLRQVAPYLPPGSSNFR